MLTRPPGAVTETERLVLRRMDVSDAPFILRLLNEPSFLRFIGDRGVHTLADAEMYVLGILHAARDHDDRLGLCLVTLRADGAPVGMCGLMRKPWLDAPDLAYAFVPEAEGKGYATEAARAVLDHGRRHGGLDRIVAVVVPENRGSIRVLEKLDFRPAGSVTDPSDGTALRLFTTPQGI